MTELGGEEQVLHLSRLLALLPKGSQCADDAVVGRHGEYYQTFKARVTSYSVNEIEQSRVGTDGHQQ